MKTEKYNVTGMTCAACQANVTRCVSKLEGVEDVNVSLLANQMTVSYDETKLQPDTIVQAVEKIGYGASSLEQQPAALEKGGFRSEWMARQDQAIAHQKEMKQRLVFSIVLLVPLMYIAMGPMMGLPAPWFFVGEENSLISALAQLLLTIPVLFINRHFFQTGFKALLHRAPTWILWWPLAPELPWFMGFLPCSGWPLGLDTGIWRSSINTPTPCILNPPP